MSANNFTDRTVFKKSWLIEDEEDERIFKRVSEIKEKYKSRQQHTKEKESCVSNQIVKFEIRASKKKFSYDLDLAEQNNFNQMNKNCQKEEGIKDKQLRSSRAQNRPQAGLIRKKQGPIVLSNELKKIVQDINGQISNKPTTKHGQSIKQLNTFLSIDFNSKPETQKLFHLIQTQIDYDQSFRKAKQCLKRNTEENKYEILQKSLSNLEVELTLQEIQSKFKVEESEFNPFSSNQISMTIGQISECWFNSENHYNQNLKHKLSYEELISEQINSLLETAFTISNFVSLLNCIGNSQYRNRDLVIFFQRIDKNSVQTNTIKISDFLSELSL